MWLEEAAILQDTQLANGGFKCLCRYPVPVPCEGYGIKGIVTLPMSLLSWINTLEGSWRALEVGTTLQKTSGCSWGLRR